MHPKREDPLENLLEAMAVGSSNMIENQEKRGKSQLVSSSVLPIKCEGQKELFEKMGIVFGEPVDNLFVSVVLPDGWTKQATDHSMWSKLVDEKGRERASIFYKAAFYDRDAFMSLSRRYRMSSYESCDSEGNKVKNYNDGTHYATVILDAGEWFEFIAIRSQDRSENDYFDNSDKHEKMGLDWLNEHYPDWKNPLAYWD